MWTQKVAEEIAEALRYLPQDKLKEARDFVLSLKENYGYEQPVDESDEWTEEDMRDATMASCRHLDQIDPHEENAHDPAG